MKRKNKQKTNMRPNEKFRYRIQRFLSKTNVTASISVATSILWFFVLVWALEFLFTTFPSILSGTSTGLSMPNPLSSGLSTNGFICLLPALQSFGA